MPAIWDARTPDQRNVRMSRVPVGDLVCHHGLVDEQMTPILRTNNAEVAVARYARLGWLIPEAIGASLIKWLAQRARTASVTIPTVVGEEVAS